MSNTPALIDQNIACLEQGIDLLGRIDDAVYLHTRPPHYRSCIGEHVRHSLEHYISFLSGLAAGRIDYDARRRDQRISADRGHAVAVSKHAIIGLRGIEADRPLRVKMDCGQGEAALWSRSSVDRDLQYLQAHTIHHYALIALILRLQDQDPGPSFGVAPSTLMYRRQQETLRRVG